MPFGKLMGEPSGVWMVRAMMVDMVLVPLR
jgi:hypothetical protein